MLYPHLPFGTSRRLETRTTRWSSLIPEEMRMRRGTPRLLFQLSISRSSFASFQSPSVHMRHLFDQLPFLELYERFFYLLFCCVCFHRDSFDLHVQAYGCVVFGFVCKVHQYGFIDAISRFLLDCPSHAFEAHPALHEESLGRPRILAATTRLRGEIRGGHRPRSCFRGCSPRCTQSTRSRSSPRIFPAGDRVAPAADSSSVDERERAQGLPRALFNSSWRAPATPVLGARHAPGYTPRHPLHFCFL